MRIMRFLLISVDALNLLPPFFQKEKKGSADPSRNRADLGRRSPSHSLHTPAQQPSPFWGGFPCTPCIPAKRRARGRTSSYLSRGLPCTWRRRSRRTRRRARRCSRTRSRSRGTGCSCTPLSRCRGVCPPPPGTWPGACPRWHPPRTRTWPPGSPRRTRTARRCRSRCRCTCRWPARRGRCSRRGSCRSPPPPACPESRRV